MPIMNREGSTLKARGGTYMSIACAKSGRNGACPCTNTAGPFPS